MYVYIYIYICIVYLFSATISHCYAIIYHYESLWISHFGAWIAISPVGFQEPSWVWSEHQLKCAWAYQILEIGIVSA